MNQNPSGNELTGSYIANANANIGLGNYKLKTQNCCLTMSLYCDKP